MTSSARSDDHPATEASSALTRLARVAYLVGAGLFTAGIVLQVLFAGMGVLVDPRYFALHVAFGHGIQWLTLVLLSAGFVGRFPRRTLGLTVLLMALFTLQYVFLGSLAQLLGPAVRALHAVNALALFWLTLQLTQRAWRELRRPPLA